jgi:GNAT superfamily N-acetyltransferase
MKIVPLNQHIELTDTLVEWFVSQWGSSRESVRDALADDRGCPPTLVAIEAAEPIGFLSYTFHVLHPRGSNELWINALYVAPAYRRRGIGSRLVSEGTSAAACTNRESMYVYSEVPTLYESLGWRRFSYNNETKMHVLEYEPGRTRSA